MKDELQERFETLKNRFDSLAKELRRIHEDWQRIHEGSCDGSHRLTEAALIARK